MLIEKLYSFIEETTDRDVHGFYGNAMDTFYGEILFPELFDEPDFRADLDDFSDTYGPDIFQALYPISMEYYFSNEYPHPRGGKSWNFIDAFLSHEKKNLSPEEVTYFKALGDSYMNLYLVKEVIPGKGFTVQSQLMIEDEPDVFVNDAQAETLVKEGGYIALRLLHLGDTVQSTGTWLKFEKISAQYLIKCVEHIQSAMLEPEMLAYLAEDSEDPKHMIKKLWVREIVCAWFQEAIDIGDTSELCNPDGDPLELVSYEYTLNCDRDKVLKVLDSLSELKVNKATKTSKTFRWIQPGSGDGLNPLLVRNLVDMFPGLASILEKDVFAEVKVKQKKMTATVNSSKRGEVLDRFLNTHLEGLLKPNPNVSQNLVSELLEMLNPQDEISSHMGSLGEEERAFAQDFIADQLMEYIRSEPGGEEILNELLENDHAQYDLAKVMKDSGLEGTVFSDMSELFDAIAKKKQKVS